MHIVQVELNEEEMGRLRALAVRFEVSEEELASRIRPWRPA